MGHGGTISGRNIYTTQLLIESVRCGENSFLPLYFIRCGTRPTHTLKHRMCVKRKPQQAKSKNRTCRQKAKTRLHKCQAMRACFVGASRSAASAHLTTSLADNIYIYSGELYIYICEAPRWGLVKPDLAHCGLPVKPGAYPG